MAIKEGAKAPKIELMDDAGNPFELSSLMGKSVVLFFYPKANTSGCTIEAAEFRDAESTFEKKNAVIVGISPDKAVEQVSFKTKLGLPYVLLCDTHHSVADAYEVWKEKTMYGKKFMGIERTTFIIDAEGKIAKIFHRVKPEGHAAQVLAAL